MLLHQLPHLKQDIILPGDQKQNPHRRLFQCQQVIVQLQCPLLTAFRNRTYHLKDLILRPLRCNRQNGFPRHDFLICAVSDQLVQLRLDMKHICPCTSQKQLHILLCNLFTGFFQLSCSPAQQGALCLPLELHCPSILHHSLVHTVSLVYFPFHKDHNQIFRQLCQILRQFFTFIFKKSCILQIDHPTIRKKRHRLSQIDHLSRIDILAGKPCKIHRVLLRTQCLYQPVSVLLPQVILLAKQQIHPLPASCLDIILQILHRILLFLSTIPVFRPFVNAKDP